jgi:hypothetical protein
MSDMYILEPLEMDVTKSRFVDGWDYEPVRHEWLANALWWGLQKIGAVRVRMSTSKAYKLRDPKNAQSVVEAVANAIKNADRFFYKRDSYAVIMGYETYRTLMNEQSQLMPMGGRAFEFAAQIGYNGRMFNVPVHVVETVKGVAVVPKVVIEAQPSKAHLT